MSTVQFWLDLGPQIIGIVCLAVYSWRRMNYMSKHLDAHDTHNVAQDRHLRVLDVHTGLISPTKEEGHDA